MKQFLLSILTLCLLLLSAYYAVFSNFNLGNLLVWLLTAAVLGYTIFWRKLDPWFVGTRSGKFVLLLLAAGGLLLCLLIGAILSGQVKNTAEGNEDTLVVLGCAVHGESPSLVLIYRLRAALAYHKENPNATIIVCGGQGPQESIPEALAMQRWLVAHGVPKEQILMEDKSTSTEENFRFAAEILRKQGKDPAAPTAFVTNGFHCYRAAKYAAQEGFSQIRAVPAGLPLAQIPTTYLRESVAVLYYWVFKSPNAGLLQSVAGSV